MNSEYSDEQLIELVHENSDEAKDILYERYKDIISYYIKKYTPLAKTLGIDINDLNQESLLGLTDAILNYQNEKDASLRTFISLCVERKIKKACIKAGRVKNQAIKDALSLDYTYDDLNMPLKELIEDIDSDPLTKLSQQESFNELISDIEESFTKNEFDVFELLSLGLNYKDIASMMDKNPKQIDNTIQRIKIKLRKILEKRVK